MPSFSYRGLPHFAIWAGLIPHFCDVDPVSHFLDPVQVEKCINSNTKIILGVCNFNNPGDIDGITEVACTFKLPLILDSVYAIGSTYKGKILGAFSNAEIYSLHATKLLNGFEGGYITTNDDELAAKLSWQRNFTLPALKPNQTTTNSILGVNAKLNEMHAAMAICSMNDIDIIIKRNKERFLVYKEMLNGTSGLRILEYASGELSNYQMVVAEVLDEWPISRDQTVEILRSEGAHITAYYSPPLHLSENAVPGSKAGDLTISENLSKRFFQLPVGELMSLEDIEKLCEFLSDIQTFPNKINKQLLK